MWHVSLTNIATTLQWIEHTSERNTDEAHVPEWEVALTLIGDECRENGGTRKLKVVEKVHSPSTKT